MQNGNHRGDADLVQKDPQHWRNWISTGDLLQAGLMIVMVSASYAKLSANNDETRTQVQQQSILLSQLHESVDQLRSRSSMTPEAAQRIAVLETRVAEVTARNESMDIRLQRIEDKIDDMRKELRR